MAPALAEGLPIPTRGIEDYFLTQGVLGVFCLILIVVAVLLYRELKSCRAEQLKEAKENIDKRNEVTEKAAAVQERMAAVIEERNRTTQSLADSLKEFAGSFAHQTEMNKVFLKQALDELGKVAARQERMEGLQGTEYKTIAALGDSLRALTLIDQKVIGGPRKALASTLPTEQET